MASIKMVRPSYGGDASDPVKWFRGKISRLEEANEEAMKEASEVGADVMRDLIRNRGTGRTWTREYGSYPNGQEGRTASTPGRVASGAMVDAVSSHHNPLTKGGKMTAQFGWRTGDRKDYFLYQEGGFEHTNGISVDGMYALVDAAEYAFKDLQKKAKENLKNA